MKAKGWVALGCIVSFAAGAQGTREGAEQGMTEAGVQGARLSTGQGVSDEAGDGVKFEFGTTLNVILSTPIDARKSRPGDMVKARASEDVKARGQVVIPRGAELLGHVTLARAAGEADAPAVLGMMFDRAEIKGGREISLRAGVYALASPDGRADSELGSYSGEGVGGGGFGGGSSGIANIIGAARQATSEEARESDSSDVRNHETLKPSAGATGGVNRSGLLYASSRGVFGIEGLSLQQDSSTVGGSSLILSTGRSVWLAGGTRMLLSVESIR